MAGLIQDSNTNGHSAAAMKKGRLKLSGRKPLGGGSNSANPFLKKASEKMVRKKNSAVIKDENGARVKKNISKAPGTRKVLGDISNSIRHQTSRTKQNAEKALQMKNMIPTIMKHAEKPKNARQCTWMICSDLLILGCPKELPPRKRRETPPMTPPRIPEEERWEHSFPESPCQYYEIMKDRYDSLNLNLIYPPKLAEH